MNADRIDVLPVDENLPSPTDIQLTEKLFQPQYDTMDKIYLQSRDIIIVGFIFILLSLPQINELLIKYFPSAKDIYISILIRGVIASFLFFVIKHFYLVKLN